MRRGQDSRLLIPTVEKLQRAVIAENQIVACAGRRQGRLAVMTLALNTMETQRCASICLAR